MADSMNVRRRAAWSTFGPQAIGAERFATVSSGLHSFEQVAGAILGKQARVQNPDRDALLPGRSCAFTCGLRVGGRDLSTVEVAAPSPAVGLGPELSLKLGQAPDPGAVGAQVGLDVGCGLAEAG